MAEPTAVNSQITDAIVQNPGGATPHKLRLTYFDIKGGRGEPARIALSIGNIQYEDARVKFQDWAKLKPETPFGTIPILEIDGKVLAQSNTINRFVGKLAGLYPTDPIQAAFCDEVMDVVEEIAPQLGATIHIKDEEEKKAKRTALADGPLTYYLTRVAQCLKERGGQYFADGRLTMADLKVYLWVRHLKSGMVDYIPTDLVDRAAPALVAHHDRVLADPRVKAYYDKSAAA